MPCLLHQNGLQLACHPFLGLCGDERATVKLLLQRSEIAVPELRESGLIHAKAELHRAVSHGIVELTEGRILRVLVLLRTEKFVKVSEPCLVLSDAGNGALLFRAVLIPSLLQCPVRFGIDPVVEHRFQTCPFFHFSL